jgi:hypothetical protein
MELEGKTIDLSVRESAGRRICRDAGGERMERVRISFSPLRGAGFFRSASAFLNLLMGTLKIVADYYPGRLHRAFVIDPPSLFSVLWKVLVIFRSVQRSSLIETNELVVIN